MEIWVFTKLSLTSRFACKIVYSEDGAFPQLHLTNGEKDSQSSGIEGKLLLLLIQHAYCLLLHLARILQHLLFSIHFLYILPNGQVSRICREIHQALAYYNSKLIKQFVSLNSPCRFALDTRTFVKSGHYLCRNIC